MVTHELLGRGLSFEDAYATARAVRSRLGHLDEVTASELQETIDEVVVATLGAPPERNLEDSVGPGIEVVYQEEPFPFSRGVLARSLQGAGLEPDLAYDLALAALEELRRDSVSTIESHALADRVSSLLEEQAGVGAARRYRLMRDIRRLPRPLVVYLGGASGTGKSSLSFDLAPLLRIHRLSSTDSIRQIMRMVFSPAILPSLHRSSFDSPAEPTPSLDDVAGGFEEQATRVCVGVRAVIERSLAENESVIVEGVHLVPPWVPFPDLEGEAYQLMLMLETRDRSTHRSHFVTRSHTSGRRAERYLDHFESIRDLQNLMLERAEEADVPTLDTTDREQVVPRALRLLTDQLTQLAPSLGQTVEQAWSPPPSLLLILDGLGDQPVRALGGRTPLEAAETPNLDRLAQEGRTGLCDPIGPGLVPDTASGNLALFGHAPRALSRGPIEAIGSGLDLEEGDLALRGNFATLGADGAVIDRRAGRIREDAKSLAEALDRLDLTHDGFPEIEVRLKAGTEHRLAVAFRGPDLSPEVEGSDPGDAALPAPRQVPRPLDANDARAERTARIIAAFEERAARVLAAHPLNETRQLRGVPVANCILTRGAGRVYQLPPLAPHGAPIEVAAVAGDRTVLGIAAACGVDAVSLPGMTANLDTDLDLKFERARHLLDSRDLVILHIKGADIAGHDRRPDLKVQFIEQIDRAVGAMLAKVKRPLRIAVAADHSTLVDSGQHSADPVPALLWGDAVPPDDVREFHEVAVQAGALQRFPAQSLLAKLLGRTFDEVSVPE